MKNWWIYKGTGIPHDGIDKLPEPPSWRKFWKDELELFSTNIEADPQEQIRLQEKAFGFQVSDNEIDVINAALCLRRPLLVTGKPGCGKSTLAYAVAYELKLGPVLRWPVTTRITLQDGLYHYDAIGRLQDASLPEIYSENAHNLETSALNASLASQNAKNVPYIGNYLRLGPLGTALLPNRHPRVLLIDEIDKSDIDLPNDLLHVFEEGEFEIPELSRISKQSELVSVMAYGSAEQRASIKAGLVRCTAFPFIVLTSNEERQFPPAFLRRCLRLEIEPPNEEKLMKIVEARLGSEVVSRVGSLITDFINMRAEGDQATDQLLNTIYLLTQSQVDKYDPQALKNVLLKSLTNEATLEN